MIEKKKIIKRRKNAPQFPTTLRIKSTLSFPAGSSSLGDTHTLEADFPLGLSHIYSLLQNHTVPKLISWGLPKMPHLQKSLWKTRPPLTPSPLSPPPEQKHSAYSRLPISATENNQLAEEEEE